MEFLILYFSGTGNTELITTKIKESLESKNHSVQMVSIEKDISELDFEGKILGFGFPVYKFSYPEIFDRVLPVIAKKARKNKYFQFSTYARFNAYSFTDFSEKLDGFGLISKKSFKSPSCGISARKPKDDYEYQSVMFFEDSISERIKEFTEEIIDKVNSPSTQKQNRNQSIISRIISRIVGDIEITKYQKLQINPDKCILCGLCAGKCPDNNLVVGDVRIEIIDDVGCLHCLRCMNHCPSNAISFGELSVGENQYTLKIRDQLFERSANGHKEKYWREFDKVIRKWRLNTLKYWLSQKFKRIT